MSHDTLMIAAVAAAAGGVAVLRAAWGQPRRSLLLNAMGWMLLLGGCAGGWIAAGAWGMAIASILAMAAATIALGCAALSSPPGKQAASRRRAGMLPQGNEPLRIGERVATFVIVVPIAGLIALGLGIALCGAARWANWSEADSNAAALLLVPVIWSVLAFVLLMQPRRASQIGTLAAVTVPALPALALGAWG